MQEVCALGPHGAGLHTQEELTLTPEVDIKHIFAGRKAACWHRAGGTEAPAVRQGGG